MFSLINRGTSWLNKLILNRKVFPLSVESKVVETLSARALRRHVWETKPHWLNVCNVIFMSVMGKDEQGREGR